MARFLITLSIFALLVVLVIGILNRNYYPKKHAGAAGYIAAIIDKHAYADKATKPKIILCGGSNVSFGMDSKAIEKQTGYTVVNLGLNGSLGLDFMLNEARYVARPKDIIIISPEYYLSNEGSYQMKKLVQRIYPTATNFFNPTIKQYLNDYFIEDLQKNLQNTIDELTNTPPKALPLDAYARGSYNENGDVARNFNANPSHQFLHTVTMAYSYFPGIKLLNNLKEYGDKNNIKVYLIYPSFPATLYKANQSVIEKTAKDFGQDLDIPQLNKPIDSVFPDALFYDTEYHLNPQGRQERTSRLLKILEANNIRLN